MDAPNTPDYLELPAPEMAATKAFYTQVFGWHWQDYGPTYAALDGAQGLEVALNGEAVSAPPHRPEAQNAVGPFALFSSDDLDALATAVTEAGGHVLTAIYPYPGGHRFHFVDPSGNVLGAYRSAPAEESNHV